MSQASLAEMGRLHVPQRLHEDADELRKETLLLAEFAREMAHAEARTATRRQATPRRARSSVA